VSGINPRPLIPLHFRRLKYFFFKDPGPFTAKNVLSGLTTPQGALLNQGLSRCRPKYFFLLSCFAYFSHLHQTSKIKSKEEVTKQYKSRFFLIFCLLMKGSGSVLIITDPAPDPDPDHCLGPDTSLLQDVVILVNSYFKI
jgi:hypothetical protein